ncbi:MAG TPA: hypothetical protein VM182_14665, partial [Terriglobia bacterium]|nr:hypothetical protein [Terriglobia bacterium]
MTRRIAILLACISIFPSLFRAQESTRGKAEVWGSLRVSIVDGATGKPLSARCYLTDSTQQSWSPEGAVNYVKPPERHFIAEGGFRIALPPRTYTLTVERGTEYRSVTREIEINSGESRDAKIELECWI